MFVTSVCALVPLDCAWPTFQFSRGYIVSVNVCSFTVLLNSASASVYFLPTFQTPAEVALFFGTCACILLACGNSFLTWIVLLTSAKIFSFVLLFCSNHHDNSINVIGLGRKTCTAAYNQSCYSLHFSTCCLLRMRKFLVFTNTLVNAQQTHTLLLC